MEEAPTQWKTKGGTWTTTKRCPGVEFKLPELDDRATIKWPFHIDDSDVENESYDMIIGSDILNDLGFKLDYENHLVEWQYATAPMKDRATFCRDMRYATYMHEEYLESEAARSASSRMTGMLPSHYTKADLLKITRNLTHLSSTEQEALYDLLKSYEDLFDGTLGTWHLPPVELELKEGAMPYHAKPYPVPKAYEETFKREVEHLCELGILRRINRSEWAFPTFIVPKKLKPGETIPRARFVTDFRKLNERLKRRPFPLPKIQDMLLRLEGFQYATSLDLNHGYYHILLSPFSQTLCTIVLPWGKYEYTRLPMGVSSAPDIFQEEMSELMQGLNFVNAYIDDVLITSKGDWHDHLHKLEQVLQRIQAAGLKINADKSFFRPNRV